MGKKGSWFSAIKRVFTHNSKEKPINGSEKKSSKEKKKGKGILSHSETKSFIPLFREPSSIEKILGEADQLFIRPSTPAELPKPPPTLAERPELLRVASPKVASHGASSPKSALPRVSSPRVYSPKHNSLPATSPKAVSPKAASPKAAAPLRASTPGATSSKSNAPLRASTPGATSSKSNAPLRASTPGSTSSKSNAPKVEKSRKEISYVQRPEPTLKNQHLSAIRIQAAYRGYVGRRSFRALRGLVRLQSVVRGQNVKRQTSNAMKQMQLLVRVQTQIQSRRIQMLENQALQHRNDKETESTLSKWTQLSEANENWDDSSLTKEEVEVRMRNKVEAVIKRERAMAYAYSHQLWKSNPKSAQSTLDIRSNGYPWWWNWLELQLPPTATPQSQAAAKTIAFTPPRPMSGYKPSPLHASNLKHKDFTFDNQDAHAPRSSKSSIPARGKQFHTPSRTPTRTPPPAGSSSYLKYSRPRASAANSAYDASVKDDDSLMSCPPFSVPNYMTPTVSAKAKVRPNSNPKERFPGTPSSDSKRRFSFPLTPSIGPFKWNKGSSKDSSSQKVMEKHRSSNSIGEMSIDSAVSMPVMGGRRPFNRFV